MAKITRRQMLVGTAAVAVSTAVPFAASSPGDARRGAQAAAHLRMEPGSAPRCHRGRHARPYAGAHVPHRCIRLRQGLRPGRLDPCAVSVCAQPRLATLLRSRSGAGGGRATSGLRHAGGREDAGAGLSLPVPGACICRKDRNRLSGDAGGLESNDLTLSTRHGLLSVRSLCKQ